MEHWRPTPRRIPCRRSPCSSTFAWTAGAQAKSCPRTPMQHVCPDPRLTAKCSVHGRSTPRRIRCRRSACSSTFAWTTNAQAKACPRSPCNTFSQPRGLPRSALCVGDPRRGESLADAAPAAAFLPEPPTPKRNFAHAAPATRLPRPATYREVLCAWALHAEANPLPTQRL